MTCEKCQLLQLENERLHTYINMLLHKVCSTTQLSLNSENVISPLKPLVIENLKKISDQKIINMFEINPPNMELFQFLVETAMLDNSRFLIHTQKKTFKYREPISNSMCLIGLTDLLSLILDIIYEVCFPIIDSENKKIDLNFSSYDYDMKNSICTKENNRTENLLSLKNEKTVLKISKFFSAFLK
tara:strand:+ start:1891 stop:2448 length:558 start_codon:yes stop_codon:yes gene_type:complete